MRPIKKKKELQYSPGCHTSEAFCGLRFCACGNVHDLNQSSKYRLMLPHVSHSAKPMLPPGMEHTQEWGQKEDNGVTQEGSGWLKERSMEQRSML